MSILNKISDWLGYNEGSLSSSDVDEDLARMQRESFIEFKSEKERSLQAFASRSTNRRPVRGSSAARGSSPFSTNF